MTAWGRINDGFGSEPDAGRGERFAAGGWLGGFGFVAGSSTGCGCGDLLAVGSADFGGGAVCDLDGGVCGIGGSAFGACLWVARGWRGGWACGRGAGGCAVEFC